MENLWKDLARQVSVVYKSSRSQLPALGHYSWCIQECTGEAGWVHQQALHCSSPTSWAMLCLHECKHCLQEEWCIESMEVVVKIELAGAYSSSFLPPNAWNDVWRGLGCPSLLNVMCKQQEVAQRNTSVLRYCRRQPHLRAAHRRSGCGGVHLWFLLPHAAFRLDSVIGRKG